jgi:hypothetical protein
VSLDRVSDEPLRPTGLGQIDLDGRDAVELHAANDAGMGPAAVIG